GSDSILPGKLSQVLKDADAISLKHYVVKPSAVKTFKEAQVTTGGISLDDINGYTLESELQQGLYFTGEVLDIDGLCGGYNLHFAWASGAIAGTAAAGGDFEGESATNEQIDRWDRFTYSGKRHE
ncbi:MAG: NAD(P)/FAD-dependent oxidoreductase, partial [Lachnospiraceae bacterium]|nr:NAD(P)/FAD-dependent oxidoreductase [Candidatus Minthocola equi]